MPKLTIQGSIDQILSAVDGRKNQSRTARENEEIVRRRKVVHAAMMAARRRKDEAAEALYIRALAGPAPIALNIVERASMET